MSITLDQGTSVSLPLVVTDGNPAAVDATTAPSVPPTSDNPASVRLVYPDPTPGIANPARSVRVDALAGSGANIHYTCDGHSASTLVVVTPLPNLGTAGFGPPSAPFPTPAS